MTAFMDFRQRTKFRSREVCQIKIPENRIKVCFHFLKKVYPIYCKSAVLYKGFSGSLTMIRPVPRESVDYYNVFPTAGFNCLYTKSISNINSLITNSKPSY